MDTVLIVDDDQFFRIYIRDFLAERQLRVLSAQDAEMALKLVMGEAIDAVLMDIYLPGIGGLELLRRIKALNPYLPVIMVTGSESVEDAVASLEQGAYDYFKKPFELPKLYSVVSQAIRHAQLDRERRLRVSQLECFERSLTDLVAFTEQRVRGEVDPSPQLFFQKVVELVSQGLQLEIVSLMLLQEKTGELRIVHATGLPQEVIATSRQPVGRGIAGWVAKEGKPLFTRDITLLPQYQESDYSTRYSTGSFMSLPITLNGKVIGVLNGSNKLTGGELTEEDLALGKSLVSVLTLALANFRLLRQQSRPATPPAAPATPPSQNAMPRILVVEDDRMTREVVKDVLELRGYRVLLAKDGLEGLERAKAELPDLIIMDVMMPKLDGFEVCRRLKGEPASQRIPIIILSAREHFEDCGADLYMHKPFQPFHLVNNVAKALRGVRTASPSP